MNATILKTFNGLGLFMCNSLVCHGILMALSALVITEGNSELMLRY